MDEGVSIVVEEIVNREEEKKMESPLFYQSNLLNISLCMCIYEVRVR